jgi:hypothetical protein
VSCQLVIRRKSDEGSATIEFVIFGLALPALLLSLLLNLTQQFRLELALESAVRQALRSGAETNTDFQAAALETFHQFGIRLPISTELTCIAECGQDNEFWFGKVSSNNSSASLVLPR